MKKNRLAKSLIVAMTSMMVLFALLFFISSQSVWRQQASALPSSILNHLSGLWRTPLSILEDTTQQVKDLFATYEQNQQLKRRLTELTNQEALLADVMAENTVLRQSLGIQKTYQEFPQVATSILVRSSVAWLDELTLDKGSLDGVEEGMLLVSEKGLLGSLTQLSEDTSRVQLLTNSVAAQPIPLKIQGKETIYGIVLGYDEEKQALKIGQFNSQADIELGSRVLTSGLDGKSPADLRVGKVLEVERTTDQSRVAYVRLSADINEPGALHLIGRKQND